MSCKLFGASGESQVFSLANSHNNFEKGQRDEFVVTAADVGILKRLQIGHDNK